VSNPIATENALAGSSAWQVTKAATTQIQAYAGAASVAPGQTITFFVSTQVAATGYTVTIYRLGWYGGNGGCLKSTSSGRTGQAQGYFDGTNLQNCPTAIIDNTTHLIDAGWTSTDNWTVPTSAVTGVYLAMFTDTSGYQTILTFVVTGNTSADYALLRADTTEAAYNNWGGWSLYTNPGVGVKVSLNRPLASPGNSGVLNYELACIRWFERQGYNLSYLSHIDVQTNAGVLLTYKAILIAGHNEYWSKEVRDRVEQASASGLGLAFLGANDSYWQMRFEADAASHPNRTITCYKVQTSPSNTLANDPQYGVDNTRVTAQWRDAVLGRPENTMIGIMYTSYNTNTYVTWTVDPAASSPLLTGTGLVAGQSYGTDLVGYEIDTVFPAGPNNLQIIGSSAFTDINTKVLTSNTTTFVASGGALVFASGSIGWTYGLDTYRYGGSGTVVPGLEQLMAHIMTALIRGKNPTGFAAFAAYHA
jgi:N,N-dimethylformamidase beta subunit-like protein